MLEKYKKKPIGRREFINKVILYSILGLSFNFGFFSLFEKYKNQLSSVSIYLLFAILIIVNILVFLKFDTFVYRRLKDAREDSWTKSLFISFSLFYPILGLLTIFTLMLREKLPKRYFRKACTVTLLATSLFLIPNRWSETFPKGANYNESKLCIARALLYDQVLVSFRYILNVGCESNLIYSIKNKTVEDMIPNSTIDAVLATEATGFKKSQTFFVLGVSVFALKIFKMKSSLQDKHNNDEKEKKIISRQSGIRLIEHQLLLNKRLKNRSRAYELTFPYITYLPGNLEMALLYAVEELVHLKFIKVMKKNISSLIESYRKDLRKSTELPESALKKYDLQLDGYLKELDETAY